MIISSTYYGIASSRKFLRALPRLPNGSLYLPSVKRPIIQGMELMHSGCYNSVQAASIGKDIVENMAMGVVEALWRAILAGKPYREHVFIGTRSLGERGTEVSFGKEASRITLLFSDERLAGQVASVCSRAAYVCQEESSYLLEEMGEDISKMEQRAREIEGMLDRLVLRPMILRTRCELCPA